MNTFNGYVVLIEWNGRKVPSTWYRRLEALGLRVHPGASNGVSLLLQRVNETGGLIYQEGAIIVPTKSTAETLAMLAKELGASAVAVANQVTVDTTTYCNHSSTGFLTRINKILGKMGKKPPNTNWVVSCHECVSSSTQHCYMPINCRNCGGFSIFSRKGIPITFLDDGKSSILDLWMSTRFTTPSWEPVGVSTDYGQRPLPVDMLILNQRETAVVDRLKNSRHFMKIINGIARHDALYMLDCIYVSSNFVSEADRMSARANVVIEFMKRGGDHNMVSLIEQNEYDLINCAPPMLVENAVIWLLLLNSVQ